jgi:hypothetical protein
MRAYTSIPKAERDEESRDVRTYPAPTQARHSVLAISTIVLSTVGLVLFAGSSSDFSFTTMQLESSGMASKFSLARKGYDALPYWGDEASEITTYKFMSSYDAIIEPHQDMTLSILTSSHSEEYLGVEVCSEDNTCYSGFYSNADPKLISYVNVPCSPGDIYSITVSQQDVSGKTLKSVDGKAICMYVRREIQSLTAEDLAETMDAMYTLWQTGEEEGQTLYGDNFHSANYFSSAHDFNAAQQDADHIHEGLGFLPQHIKLTNMFELAMQAVNPAVSMPYWDFTIDVAENKTIFDSFVFTESTFGGMKKPKDEYWGWTYKSDSLEDSKIQSGRWANLQADLNSFDSMGNGFGYMRGPWNMNPSPYVSRFSAYSPSLPSCSDYYGGVGLDGFTDFLSTAPYGSHASTHGVIGAVYGCDKLDAVTAIGIIKDADSQLSICKKWGFYMKELYRGNYIESADDCSVSSLTESGVSCGFSCKADSYDDLSDMLKSTISGQYLKSDMKSGDWEVFRDFVCSGDGYRIFVGDHLESASPSDPSFWPIHPTQERLLQLKYMILSIDGDSSWPSDAKVDYVCDKPSCYSSDEGAADYYASCCYGHYEGDQLLNFASGDKDSHFGSTNREVMDDTDPTQETYGMTYIYDHFSWDHCDEDFDALIEKTYERNSGAAPPAVPSASNLNTGKR